MKTNSFIKSISRLSLSDQVYQALKIAIISLELEPGKKIKDVELAKQFKVSRTPIREAMKRLENEGLIVAEPGSLTRVTNIDMEEVKQVFVVVAALHGLAARLAVPSLTEKDFTLLKKHNNELRLSIEKGDVFKAIEADDDFHGVFLKASKNEEIYVALEPLMPRLRRLEFKKFDSVKAMSSVKDHQEIIVISKQGDKTLLSEKVEQNWLSLKEQLIE